MNSYNYGIFAEYFLIVYLFFCGYKVLKRRYKTPCGEIDILATKNKDLIAFEVKARKNKGLLTTEIVSKTQLKRIFNSLKIFISNNNKYLDYNIYCNIVLFNSLFSFKIISGDGHEE